MTDLNPHGKQMADESMVRTLDAQARAILVLHWAVDSNATVKLITTTMRETANGAKAGRAEALRPPCSRSSTRATRGKRTRPIGRRSLR